MLCDLILQDKLHHEDRWVLKQLPQLQRDLQQAQKFVLDRSMAVAADAVEAAEIEKVLGSCRVPFASVWIEVLQQDRPKFWTAPLRGARDYFARRPTTIADDVFLIRQPKRLGLLIRCADDSRLRFLATMVWSFPDDRVTVSMLSLAVDLSDDPDQWLGQWRSKLGGLVQHPAKLGGLLIDRLMPLPTPYHANLIDLIMSAQGGMSAAVATMLQEGLADWAHEPQFWLAVLALLNCRNVAVVHSADLTKLNRARHKAGKPLLSEHKVLKLRLPGAARAAADQGGAHGSPRGHFVRGHFKTRRTGIYYWHDFYRGDRSRPLTKTYQPEYEGEPE